MRKKHPTQTLYLMKALVIQCRVLQSTAPIPRIFHPPSLADTKRNRKIKQKIVKKASELYSSS